MFTRPKKQGFRVEWVGGLRAAFRKACHPFGEDPGEGGGGGGAGIFPASHVSRHNGE